MKKSAVAFFLLITTFVSGQTITNSIIVGGVTDSSVRFWLRIDQAGTLNIELSLTDDFTNTILGNSTSVETSTNFAGIVDVSGLLPDTKYYYRGVVNGVPESGVTRSFITFPKPGEKYNFSFAFGSCQQSGTFLPSQTERGDVFREIVKHDLRFFLQLGDWTYPDTTDLLPLFNTFFPTSFEFVQNSYFHKFNKDYPMDSLLRTMPVDYIYDDHDYMNDNSGARTSSFWIPVKPNPLGSDFVAKEFANPSGARENSIRGYKENMPTYPLVNESRGIYHKFTFGNVDVFALDLRAQRNGAMNAFEKNASTGRWEFNPPAGHSILGREDAPGSGETQLDWFLRELKNSTADWKFLMSSVPFNIGQKAVLETGLAIQDSALSLPGFPDGVQGIFAAFELSDKWIGFPEDVDTVMNFIEANEIKNVIVLSGDSHNAAMDDGTNSGLPEIMAGGLEITNSKTVAMMESFDIHIWNKGGQGITTTEFNNAFGKITVFGADSMRMELIDEFGERFGVHTIVNETATDIAETGSVLPTEFTLEQNFPNPFNPSTTIKFSIPAAYGNSSLPLNASLKIYNALGENVAILFNRLKSPGNYSVVFNAGNLASGIYFYNLTVGSKSVVRKMLLLR